jgi:transposase-like protein
MTLQEFMQQYSSESSCKEAFKQYRLKVGVVCKKCQHDQHYWLSTLDQFKCKNCGFRTGLKSGTALEASKLPYHYWLTAMFLMTKNKRSISSCDLQRMLGHKRNEPIWLMMHKIRISMGNRDDLYTLKGTVEMDEAFFETVDPDQLNAPLKRGRGSQKQSAVMVIAESEEVEEKKQGKHRKKRRCGYFKMRVMDDLTSVTINKITSETVDYQSTVLTDGYKSYNKLKKVVAVHHATVCPPKLASKQLPWVHTAIANAKRVMLGAYHRINKEYLQNYLDEFCYRLNRRYFSNMFERLMIAACSAAWYI